MDLLKKSGEKSSGGIRTVESTYHTADGIRLRVCKLSDIGINYQTNTNNTVLDEIIAAGELTLDEMIKVMKVLQN